MEEDSGEDGDFGEGIGGEAAGCEFFCFFFGGLSPNKNNNLKIKVVYINKCMLYVCVCVCVCV